MIEVSPITLAFALCAVSFTTFELWSIHYGAVCEISLNIHFNAPEQRKTLHLARKIHALLRCDGSWQTVASGSSARQRFETNKRAVHEKMLLLWWIVVSYFFLAVLLLDFWVWSDFQDLFEWQLEKLPQKTRMANFLWVSWSFPTKVRGYIEKLNIFFLKSFFWAFLWLVLDCLQDGWTFNYVQSITTFLFFGIWDTLFQERVETLAK